MHNVSRFHFHHVLGRISSPSAKSPPVCLCPHPPSPCTYTLLLKFSVAALCILAKGEAYTCYSPSCENESSVPTPLHEFQRPILNILASIHMSGLLEMVNHDVNSHIEFQYKQQNTVTENTEHSQFLYASSRSAVQEIPSFYGTHTFITVCTRARHRLRPETDDSNPYVTLCSFTNIITSMSRSLSQSLPF